MIPGSRRMWRDMFPTINLTVGCLAREKSRRNEIRLAIIGSHEFGLPQGLEFGLPPTMDFGLPHRVEFRLPRSGI